MIQLAPIPSDINIGKVPAPNASIIRAPLKALPDNRAQPSAV